MTEKRNYRHVYPITFNDSEFYILDQLARFTNGNRSESIRVLLREVGVSFGLITEEERQALVFCHKEGPPFTKNKEKK